jgi:hypothetical protein
MMAVRCADCTRRQHRNREASELAALRQPTLLIRFRHWRRVAIDGDPNGNGNGNRNCNSNGNRNGNSNGHGNGRCAELTAIVAAHGRPALIDHGVMRYRFTPYIIST